MDTSIYKKRSKSHEHDDGDINDRKKRQKRQKYTEDELRLLEQVYAAGCKMPSMEKRQELAQVLGRSARSVQVLELLLPLSSDAADGGAIDN